MILGVEAKWQVTQGILGREIAKVRKAKAEHPGEKGKNRRMIKVTYNPAEVSFEDIMRVHLGTQYRSVIFYRNDEEKQTASNLIKEYETALEKPVVTEVKAFSVFFAAEDEHQNYLNENGDRNPYCD